MKLVFAFFAAVAAAFGAFAEEINWYTPAGEWAGGDIGVSYVAYCDEYGEWKYAELPINKDGSIDQDALTELQIAWGLDPVAMMALDATRKALEAQAMAYNIASKLDNLYLEFSEKNADGSSGSKQYAKIVSEKPNGTSSVSIPHVSSYSIGHENGTYYLKKDGNAVAPSWASGASADNASLESYDDNGTPKMRIKSWNTPSGYGWELAKIMKGEHPDNYYVVARPKTGGNATYLSVGSLGQVGAGIPDETTIVTNAPDHEGEISLKGFHDSAVGGSVPYANAGTFQWTGAASAGAILTGSSIIPGAVKWSSTQASGKYYGTPNGGNSLGWNTLPNVTTNAVEADNETIEEELDGDRKIFSLKTDPPVSALPPWCWSPNGWVSVPVPTNDAQIVVADNASLETKSTVVRGVTNNVMSIKGWSDVTEGKYFVRYVNGTPSYDTMTANYPLQWDSTNDMSLKLDGWDSPQCTTSIAAMLTDNAVDRAKHKVLCRYESDGNLTMHYAAIGELSGVVGSANVDGLSVSTNSASATYNGKIHVNGIGGAAAMAFPYKAANGSISWTADIPDNSSSFVLVRTGATMAWKKIVSTDIVVGMEYNTSTKKFTFRKKSVNIITTDNTEPTETTVDVFTTKPISQ